MTHIVGLIGQKGAGKSTAAQLLAQNHGFSIVKMAGPLKNMLRQCFYDAGYSEEETERYVEGDMKEEPVDFLMGRTCRHAMQTLGTQWGRDCIHNDFWMHMFGAMAGQRNMVVCDDIRFQNEAEYIVSQGGVLVRIIGIKELDPDYELQDRHESEIEIASIPTHHHVINDGSIMQLYKGVYDVAFTVTETRHIVEFA